MRVLLTSAGLETEEIKKYFMDMTGKDMSVVKALFIPAAAIHSIYLLAYINDNGLVIGVSAGSLIFSNNLENNLGLIDTKLKQLYFMLKEAL